MGTSKSDLDLTEGPIARKIVLFALPLLLASLIQQLYSTVDLLFVGNVLGTAASAALGISSLLITCLLGFFSGVSTGVTVVAGHLFGAKDEEGLAAATRASLVFALAAGLVVALFGHFFSPLYLDLMETPSEALDDARVYLNFYFVAMIPTVFFDVAAGALRAVGDSSSPLAAQAAGGLLNVLMDFLLLCVAGFGIEGAALATLASNTCAAAVALAVLAKKGFLALPGATARRKGASRVRRRSAGQGKGQPALKKVLSVGLPMGLQSMVVTLANIIAQRQIDLLSVEAVAAFTAYFKVELPIYYAILAVGQATTAFVAQNLGAGEEERARRGSWICQGLGLAVAAVLSAFMLLVGYWAFWMFNQDPAVIAVGRQIIAITFPFYFIYAVFEVQSDTIRGYGRSVAPAIVAFLNICVFRTLLIVAFTWDGATVEAIAAAYPISWGTAAACMLALRFFCERRQGAELVQLGLSHSEDVDGRPHTHLVDGHAVTHRHEVPEAKGDGEAGKGGDRVDGEGKGRNSGESLESGFSQGASAECR